MPSFITNAFQSPEFYKAFVGIAGALGVVLEPAQQNAIVGACLALVGLINAFKHVTGK